MDLYPLSKPQMSIWNMERYFGGSIANITGSAFFNEHVEINQLQAALNHIVESFDSLRIRISFQDGIPMQFITEYKPREFDVLSFINKSTMISIKRLLFLHVLACLLIKYWYGTKIPTLLGKMFNTDIILLK